MIKADIDRNGWTKKEDKANYCANGALATKVARFLRSGLKNSKSQRRSALSQAKELEAMALKHQNNNQALDEIQTYSDCSAQVKTEAYRLIWSVSTA